MMSNSSNQIVLIFVVGTAGMLLMAGSIVLFVNFYQKKMMQEQLKHKAMEVDYQKKMLEAALTSQENERSRVSKDLHDDVGMMLMTIRMQINSLVLKFSEEQVSEVYHLVDEAHETVRRLSWDLMPSTMDLLGLTNTIAELCSRLSKGGTTSVEFAHTGQRSFLAKAEEIVVFRIVQESVSNALRHANARHIQISYVTEDESATISIKDDGKGFDFRSPQSTGGSPSGLGLINMENRASLLGARLVFEKNLPTGSIVKLIIPRREPI